jgi:hypothetical protein
MLLDLAPSVPFISWKVTGTYAPRQPGSDLRLQRLTDRLRSSLHRDTAARELHVELSAIVDERLARRHGVDRLTQPERAAEILGPELATYLATAPPTGRSVQLRRLSTVLTRIEEL